MAEASFAVTAIVAASTGGIADTVRGTAHRRACHTDILAKGARPMSTASRACRGAGRCRRRISCWD